MILYRSVASVIILFVILTFVLVAIFISAFVMQRMNEKSRSIQVFNEEEKLPVENSTDENNYQQEESNTEETEKYCQYCGCLNNGDEKRCSSCGAKFKKN